MGGIDLEKIRPLTGPAFDAAVKLGAISEEGKHEVLRKQEDQRSKGERVDSAMQIADDKWLISKKVSEAILTAQAGARTLFLLESAKGNFSNGANA